MTIGELIFKAWELLWSILWPFFIVNDYEQGVVYFCGRILDKRTSTNGVLNTGLHLYVPILGGYDKEDSLRDADETQPQTVETSDGKCLLFSLSLSYSVVDAAQMYRSIIDHETTLHTVAMTVAAEGARTLERDQCDVYLTDAIMENLAPMMEEWGVDLHKVGLVNNCVAKPIRLFHD